MPNRTAKFVSTVFAGVLAGATFTAILDDTARADDGCLSEPKNETPTGSHWYYRIDHATNRHCWYIREEGDARAQTIAPNRPSPAEPAPPTPETAMQGSVANARAELPSPQTPTIAPDPSPATGQSSPAAASPATADNDPRASALGTNLLQTTVASRWPDQLAPSTSVARSSDDSAPPATDHPDTSAQPAPVAVPPPPAATAALAVADASSESQPGSVQMQLTVMIATLALASLVGAVIFRLAGRRRGSRERNRLGQTLGQPHADRRAIWDVARNDGPLPYPAAAARRPNIGIPRELHAPEYPDDDRVNDDRISEMLARLARSAQT
ncbi:hypothetical protein [Bradyrhizobium sp. dw_78]|uniref:hypothetical protein n=1 Tax=Bradyrhizobium sp. dw_78 TaxID=2719793 RepID=UPI001BD694F8|nr:hypothetical protein [Bradyrhizobium sp. dw_78]